jgi:hypothetical protein
MSKKYIIKNCPNLTTSYYGTGETIYNQCGLTDDDLCANCTHCVLKQVVKLCKKAIKDCDKCKGDPETDCYDCTQGGKAIQSDKILELFDIEECK